MSGPTEALLDGTEAQDLEKLARMDRVTELLKEYQERGPHGDWGGFTGRGKTVLQGRVLVTQVALGP